MFVDRHSFDAYPDPTFHFGADPDPNPTHVLHMLENLKNSGLFLLFTAVPV